MAKTHGLAVASMIIGIFSLFLSWVPVLGLLLGIAAVIFGIISVKKTPMKGKGMAISGMVLGGIVVIIGLSIIGNMDTKTANCSSAEKYFKSNGMSASCILKTDTMCDCFVSEVGLTAKVTDLKNKIPSISYACKDGFYKSNYSECKNVKCWDNSYALTIEGCPKPECTNNSECQSGFVCVDYACCQPECTSDSCSGQIYIKCTNSATCGKKTNLGPVKGKCGVECSSSSDCAFGERCSIGKCVSYGLNEKVQAGNFVWTITGVSRTKTIGGDYFTTVADGEYLIISVQVENTGKSAQYLSGDFLKLIDDKGREFSADSSASFYLGSSQSIFYDTINPGIVKKGKIVYDVPENLRVVSLRISDSLLESSFYTVKLVT